MSLAMNRPGPQRWFYGIMAVFLFAVGLLGQHCGQNGPPPPPEPSIPALAWPAAPELTAAPALDPASARETPVPPPVPAERCDQPGCD